MNNIRMLSRALLALGFMGIMYLYINTMPPVFANNDSPETSAAAHTLGIGHPPGYPLHAMTAKIVTLLPLANQAFRVNLAAVLFSMLVLVMTYIISLKLLRLFYIPGEPNEKSNIRDSTIAALTCVILALSGLFWNQGIEAKGGIYILNLLFFSVMVYISIILLEKFNLKYLYLLSFVFGLALTNHWPSVIILAPVAAYLYILHFKKLNLKRWFYMVLFFAAGLSAYLYLPIRAAASPALNWGDPDNLTNLLAVIMRKAYVNPVKPSLDVYSYQIVEFLRLFAVNYSAFTAAAMTGGFMLYRKSKKHFFYLASLFAVVVVMVIFYNRSYRDLLNIFDNFLLPAEYIVLIMTAPGLLFIFRRLKSILAAGIASAAVIAVLFVLAFTGYRQNNSGFDYMSYDYGYNLLDSMPSGSVYLASGDFNAMPVYYITEIEKRRGDIKFATESFLIFKWGIDDFVSRTQSKAAMEPYKRDMNIRNIIDEYSAATPVYRNFYWENPVQLDVSRYIEQQYGILMKINRTKERTMTEIFRLYNYRGIFEKRSLNKKENRQLATWYPVCMVNSANALMEENRYVESIWLNKMALRFPLEKPEGNILYNIAYAYNKLEDRLKEMQYLKLAAAKGTDILAVYERLGLLYYDFGLLDKALPLFNEALRRKSLLEYVSKGKSIIEGFSQAERLEIALMKANEKLIVKDVMTAHEIYEYLLEKRYKVDIIHTNLGVYHFKTGSYEAALEEFVMSENETKSPGIALYKVYTLEKLNRRDESLKELEKALQLYPQDKPLMDLFKAIKESEKNGKSTHSADRPR